jgi:hypothetical protein
LSYGHFKAIVAQAKIVHSILGGRADWHIAELVFQLEGTGRKLKASLAGRRLKVFLTNVGAKSALPKGLKECIGKDCVLYLRYKAGGGGEGVLIVDIYSPNEFAERG